MSRLALLSVLISIPAFVACSGSAAPATSASSTSTVKGTVALSAYAGLDNPVILSRSASGRVFVAPITRTGAFKLDLPTNDSYRIVLASTRTDRSYAGVSELHWDGGVVWGKLHASLDFGTIRPIGSNASAPSAGSVGAQDHGGDTSGGSYSGGSGGGGGGDTSSSGGGGASSSTSGADDSSSASASTCKMPGEAKLPYDVKPQLGQTFRLTDAFLLEGPLPASVVSVTMDGGNWRMTELSSNAPFTITQADCDHQGNRDIGRDRVFITWTNAGGGQQSDHLDLRYCEAGNRVPDDAAATAAAAAPSSGECGMSQTPICKPDSGSMPESECTGDHMDADYTDYSSTGGVSASDYGSGGGSGGDDSSSHCDDDVPVCPPGSGTTGTTSSGNVPAGGGCVTNADCAAGLACFSSTCVAPIR